MGWYSVNYYSKSARKVKETTESLILGFDEGLTFAYNDIEKNWERYRQQYMSKLEKK